MAIYRGAGGAGDATADSSSEALLVRQLAVQTQASADAAAASASAASSSASSASTSESNASTSATSASTSASSASTSATNASTSASTATTQASAASTSATAAASSATSAASSATTATTQASNASTSASGASTSATNASNSATTASTQATNAAASASAASTSATNAASSATSAAGSATGAASSASSASTSATNAAASSTSAGTSASTATTQAGIATTQASNASSSASAASTSASNASTSATNAAASATSASGSASTATTQASNASTSASNAATSATNAANSATTAASYTPSQTGNAGKYLTTNGTATSWTSVGNFTTTSTSSTTSTTPVLSFNASNTSTASGATVAGSYLQHILQNKSGTAGASTNYVLSNDLGTDSTYYGEFGMNSSVYSTGTPSDFFSLNNGVYFSSHDGDVTVGSGNGGKHYLAWGTVGQSAHVINAAGAIGLSTNLGSTPSTSGTTGFGTSGQVLTSGGSGAPPTWSTPAATGVTSFSAGTTGLTPSTATTGAVSLAGTLAVGNGGTGVTTSTGSGNNVLSTSPTLTTPVIDKINTSVANTSLGAGNSSIMKNRIINGACLIDQRNGGNSVTQQASVNTYAVDRIFGIGGVASKFTMQQSSTAPAGFNKSLLVTSSSSYSVPSGDLYVIGQAIEGFNVADLGWGTSDAKTITVSFWARSSLTGTFGGSVGNANWLSNTRSYPFSYSLPTANTWTQISVTIPGDTTGTWNTGNTTGLTLSLGMGVGSSSSGTAGAWVGSNVLAPTGAVSVVGTSGATFYVTGLQLEVGTAATGYEYVNYQTLLSNCQRYYEPLLAQSPFWTPLNYTTYGLLMWQYREIKRAAPTLGSSGSFSTDIFGTGGATVISSGIDSATTSSARVTLVFAGSYTVGTTITLTSQNFYANAEL